MKTDIKILTLLPSDAEITKHWHRNNCFGHYLEGLVHGSQWMREKSTEAMNKYAMQEAVEFDKWKLENKWEFGGTNVRLEVTYYKFVDSAPVFKTSAELYELFKESK